MDVFLLGAGRPAHGQKPSALKHIALNTKAMDWQIHSFKSIASLDEIHYLGGYHVDAVIEDYPQLNFSVIPDWHNRSILHTLLKAPFVDRPAVITYSDTVFRNKIMEEIVSVLTECNDFEFTDVSFDQVITDFRRPKSKEFIGEMAGRNSIGHQLAMNCKESDADSKNLRGIKTISIENGTKHHFITVFPDQVTHRTLTGKSETVVTEPLPLQSQITHRLVEDIVRNGACGLPTYPDSMTLHLSLIREFLSHLTKITGKNVTRCPIT